MSKYGLSSGKLFYDKEILLLKQNDFKRYFKQYNICRKPDEAYVVKYTDTTIKRDLFIIEKKNQNVNGSVSDKLLTGPAFIEYYTQILENEYNIFFIYTVSKFLQDRLNSDNQQFKFIKSYCIRHNIKFLYGDEPDYFETLNKLLDIK
jgi:hypothetical protein